MNLIRDNETRTRKIVLTILLCSNFASGYLWFINFDIAGISFNLFRIVLVIFACACAILVFRNKLDINCFLGKARISLGIFFVLCIGIGLLNIALGKNNSGALSEVAAISFNALYLLCLIIITADDLSLWKYCISILKYIGMFIAAFGYFEIISGFKLPSSRFAYYEYFEGYSVHPATSFFTNENNMAAFMLIVSIIVVLDMFRSETSKKLVLHSAELMFIMIPMAMTDSTIYRLGMGCGIVLSIILFIKILGFGARWCKASASVLALYFSMCIFLKSHIRLGFIKLNLYIVHGVRDFDFDINSKLISGDTMGEQLQNLGMGTVTIRKNLFLCGVDATKEHPILGNGPNSFAEIFKHTPEYLKETGGMINPHNFLSELMVQYGIPLMVFFSLIYAGILFLSLIGSFRKIETVEVRESFALIAVLCVAFAFTTIMPSGFIKGTEYFVPLFLICIGFDIIRKKCGGKI